MGAGEIKYDKFPQIMPLYSNDNKEIVDTFQPFFLTKAPYWNYELEYRFIDYPCSERKKYMGDILDSIYMGCNISKEDEIFIKDFCKKDSRKITLYKAEKTFFKYEVEYNKVAY